MHKDLKLSYKEDISKVPEGNIMRMERAFDTFKNLIKVFYSENIFDKQEKMGEIKVRISSLENFFAKGSETIPSDNLLEKAKLPNKSKKNTKGKNRFSVLFE